jgi:hypothetical protein
MMTVKWKVTGLLCVSWFFVYTIGSVNRLGYGYEWGFYGVDEFIASSIPFILWLICWWIFGDSRRN